MKGKSKKFFFLIIVVVLAISIVACGDGATMKKIEKSGKLVIGTSADYPPYEYHALISGKDTIVGVDISIAEEISKDLGVQLEIIEMGYEELLPELNNDKVDIVISGMVPDEARKASADFSRVYYQPKQGIMVRAEDKEKIKSIGDFKGKKVGVQPGTVQEKIAREQIKDAEIVTLEKISDIVIELKSKKIDAMVVELPVAKDYEKNNNDLSLSEVQVKEETSGFSIAVKKGNAELLKMIDQSLDRIILDGSIDKFVREAYALK